MTHHIPETVFWCLLVGALAVVVLLIRQRQITTAIGKRTSVLEARLRAYDEELHQLATVRLPALASSPSPQSPATTVLDETLVDTAFAQSLRTVTELFVGVVNRATTKADLSAKAALKASMRALQGLANEQQIAISDMQQQHDNPDVLRDLLEIDHANSQFGRRAQAIAVLCGSWPGRQRAASSVLDVARGATSRIRDYQRIQINSQVDICVVSRAVEPVVLAVAELLDNAARHSQPNTKVQVSLQPSHSGACIVIDDAGVGMNTGEIERASKLLTGQYTVDVTRLGDPPQFGFSVVGVLVARYGFSVSVDTRSPYGGVRAVVFIPGELLTHSTDAAPGTAQVAKGGHSATATESDQPASPQKGRATAGGLPKRRRRAPVESSAAPALEPETAAPAKTRSARETARRMGDFARGTKSGRASLDDEEGNQG